METKVRECIGYEIAPRLGIGKKFIISDMDWSEYAMRHIGAIEKIYFIEKIAYEKLQKRVEELEAENKKLGEALHRIRHHVVGFKSNGEILSEIDEALGEVENGN